MRKERKKKRLIMGSNYFQRIYEQLCLMEIHAPWANQVQEILHLHKIDMVFLKMFSMCIESWDFTSSDQESKIDIFKSMSCWLDEYLSILIRLDETWPVDVQGFFSVAFELVKKTKQSKLQIELWCENLVGSSLQCKASGCYEVFRFLIELEDILSYKGVKVDSLILKAQISTLKEKLVFLRNSLENIPGCIDSKEFQDFVNFIRGFANNAACLTCLYWAKEESNEEEQIGTEMNILLFDMLHKFKTSAPDITALFFGILKSNNFLYPSYSIRVGEIVAAFVDFFFENQAITPLVAGDDFMNNRLIYLFTFLIQNAKEDKENLIRSQVYALFHEHPYLFLTFHEMEEDFHNDKFLLNDFLIKIELANSNVRQVYRGGSSDDYCISIQEEEIDYAYNLSVQRELYLIEKNAVWAHRPVCDQLQLYRKEFRFLWLFLQCFAKWDGTTDEQIRAHLRHVITSLQGIWGQQEEKGPLYARIRAIRKGGDIAAWQSLAFELEGKFQLSKLVIDAWLVNLFHLSFSCKPSVTAYVIKFLDCVFDNLKDLLPGNIVQFKIQIDNLYEKLLLIQNLLKLTTDCVESKELGEFNIFVQSFANSAACLTFLCWAKHDINVDIATDINLMLSYMFRTIKPATPDVAGLYFGTLKAICLQRSDSILFAQTASNFVDFFLEDLVIRLKDDFHILRDDIIFLLTFLNDPPNGDSAQVICSQIDILLCKVVHGLLPIDDKKEDFPYKNALLSDFCMKIGTIYAKITQMYCKFPDSSIYSFPRITGQGSLDLLIQNLRNLKLRMVSDSKYLPFAKYKIMKIEEELVSLTPFFNHMFKLQEQKELKDTWLQVVNFVQLTEHVINASISSNVVFDHPIWYHMAYLSDVFNRMKVVKTKLEEINESDMCNAKHLTYSLSINTLSEQARTSEINELVVGFEDEVDIIVGNLTRGTKSLDIVSIVGMGGSGKTTLAKKIYCSPEVKSHFNLFALCSVSHDHKKGRILLDILNNFGVLDDKIIDEQTEEDDLAHQLWKCLSHQKYLIVLDDIWDINAWNDIKSSFPDDQTGSRVMITTRSHTVAEQWKIKCSPHHLRFLSDDESWDLLRNKVFHNGIAPPNLYDIGKLIAKNCKGLPLSIVVIAGLLARTKRSLFWWNEVSKRVGSYVSDGGCMDALELSYTYLPGYLKPCFLYLGAFPEDMRINVKKVMLLWIAEGFIQESKTKSLKHAARDHFNELVARCFIIIHDRSSRGNIKKFYVHDVIRDFCQSKCRDENFLQLGHGIATSAGSTTGPSIYNHYRVSMQEHTDNICVAEPSSLLSTRSLLHFYRRGVCFDSILPLIKHAQVLDLEHLYLHGVDSEQLAFLVHLRHFEANIQGLKSIQSSVSNLWNMESLILRNTESSENIYMGESLWRMKWLRHVEIKRCRLEFSDEPCGLDKVVSFSKPILYSEKDVEQILKRLPAVVEFSCLLDIYVKHENIKTLSFHRWKLESLKLDYVGTKNPFLITFPSTLQKLTIMHFQLPLTTISTISELPCLEVLKLRWISFPEPRLEMEDMTFPNLKFLELRGMEFVQWNASFESFPCLEQLLIIATGIMEELPPCLGEISTLKRIEVGHSPNVETSALQVLEQHKELGNEVEVLIT